jgi:phosphoenolpyruvate synthase/pyruvate phosphate dikinase
MRLRYFRRLAPGGGQRKVGGKTAGLKSLMGMRLRVPRTYVCSAKAREHYSKPGKGDRVIARLKRELSLIGLSSTDDVAVRSSAELEDGARQSMAGQFGSFLHVRGVDRVIEAILSAWEPAKATPSVPLSGDVSRRVEVLVQEMVCPIVSGAAFSRNPVTGADEVIIEAVEGTSEALLQHGVTPRRWVIKQDEAQSDWALVPTGVLREITETTRRVASELRYPADLEWAYDGKMLWWLQVRPITSLRGLPVYSNRISREYLPGLVKPLVWSVNVPMINGAWVDLFERLVGRLAMDPLSLARQFHYRAYFNMSGMGELFRRLGLEEDTLEQLLGIVASDAKSGIGFRWRMLLHLPRVLWFAASLLAFHRRTTAWVARRSAQLDRREADLGAAIGMEELLEWVDEMLPIMRDAARFRILALLLHLALGQLGRRALARQGVSDPSKLELRDPRLEELDPALALRRLAEVFAKLPAATRQSAEDLTPQAFLRKTEARSFSKEFRRFLEHFGHLSESGNDFSAKPWQGNPAGVLEMVIAQATVEGSGQRERVPASETHLTGRWARRVTKRRVDRERIGAVFSRGFYLLHMWAMKLGRVLQVEGTLDDAEDVFLLHLEEVRNLASGKLCGPDARQGVLRRQEEMARSASISLPDQILGDRIPDAASRPESEDELSGIGVSRGIYEGPVSVVRSLEEASRFRDGDVLVVPYSDIAWTPLFARAGAIIAEAGGILSHSAITARELDIPAVVSVAGACELSDGTGVRVDGLEGRVTLLDVSSSR